MTFRAIILDFDGLIMDSETPLFEIWQAIYQDRGGTLTLDAWQDALGTQHGFDPYGDLERQTGVALSRDEWAAHVRSEHWRRCEAQPLLAGVVERLEEARQLGLGTAVASSSGRGWVAPWLQRHGLAAHVDVVCTREDVAHVKPAPDLFLLAAERLGVAASECVVFEDSPNGIRAALAAGAWCVAVPHGLTRTVSLPDPHVVLASLAACTLAALQEQLQALDSQSPPSTSTGSTRMARRAGR